MTTHLAHKIPWDTVEEIYTYVKVECKLQRTVKPLPCHRKQLGHVARVFVSALREFKETDKTSEDDKQWMDPISWCDYDWSMRGGPGGLIGIYDSLVWGYIELNLLLLDPHRFAPLVLYDGKSTMVMCCMLGSTGTGHGRQVADRFKAAFEADRDTMKPLTPEVLDILRDHAKLLFKCMYLVSGENRLLDDKEMTSAFLRFFGWYPDKES